MSNAGFTVCEGREQVFPVSDTSSSRRCWPIPHSSTVRGRRGSSQWFIIPYSAQLHSPRGDSRRRGEERVPRVVTVVTGRSNRRSGCFKWQQQRWSRYYWPEPCTEHLMWVECWTEFSMRLLVCSHRNPASYSSDLRFTDETWRLDKLR